MDTKSHVLGIGGIFFKSTDPDKLQKWYEDHLGFTSQVPYDNKNTAITFKWKPFNGENHNTVWAPFPENTNYFQPSESGLIINYIVRDIETLIEKLKEQGIHELDKIRSYKYGKFTSVMDPDGNKIEFWEPNKDFFQQDTADLK